MQTGTLTVSVLVTTRGAQLAQESAGRVGIGAGVTTEELCVATGITDSEVMVSQGVLLEAGASGTTTEEGVGLGAWVASTSWGVEVLVAMGITDSEVRVSQGVLLGIGVEEMTGVEETLAEEETWTTGIDEAEDCTMATEEDEEGVWTGVTAG